MTWELQGEGSSPPAHCGTFFQREIPSDWHNLVQGDVVPSDGHPPVRIQEETAGGKQSEDRGHVAAPQVRSGSLRVFGSRFRLGPWGCAQASLHMVPSRDVDGSSRLTLPHLGELRFVRKPRA